MIDPKTPATKDDAYINEDNLDQALEDSFPASDPLPIMTGAGAPSGRETPPLPDNLSLAGDPEDDEVAEDDEDEDELDTEDDDEIEDEETEEELLDDPTLVDDPVGSDDDVAQDSISGFTPRR
jgi:hypothetical protein